MMSGACSYSAVCRRCWELQDALLVNPYDINQTAEAIRTALEMSPEEMQARMQRLRKVVRENNVFRWAGTLIGELCELRLDIQHPDKREVGYSGAGRALILRRRGPLSLTERQIELEQFIEKVAEVGTLGTSARLRWDFGPIFG